MFVSDLDDTLYHEIDYVISGYHAIGRALEQSGLMSECEAVGVLTAAETTAGAFDRLAALIDRKNQGSRFTAQWMVEVYRYHTPHISLLPGVAETFEALRNAGETIAIITDGRSATQRAKFIALGLDRFVDSDNLIISGETGADKRSPLPFEIIVSRNPDQRRFLYIGDNPAKDFRWPNSMGWLTIMLRDIRGCNIHSQQIDVAECFRAAHTVDSYPEALRLWRRFML